MRISGHVQGRGRVRHDEFAFASGEMSDAAFRSFLSTCLGSAAAVSRDGAVHFVCMDWRHIDVLMAVGRNIYSAMLNLVVWNKTNPGQGSFYRSQHELIGVFRVGETPHQNNVELGKHGRNRGNVWTYSGVNSFGAGRDDALAMHPTVKPVALGRRRHARLQLQGRYRPRPIPRLGHDRHGGREDRPALLWPRI